MGEKLYEKRKLEFIQTLRKEKRLPKTWEFRFSDGEDMRVWFDKISKLEQFKDFLNEVNKVLNGFNKKILTDKESLLKNFLIVYL